VKWCVVRLGLSEGSYNRETPPTRCSRVQVWEIAGSADFPPPIAKLTDRIPFSDAASTILLRVPPINAQRIGAVEAVLDAQVRRGC
jgi:hypothetical protein